MKNILTKLLHHFILFFRRIELRHEKSKFINIGQNCNMELPMHILNHEAISIGDNFFSRFNLRIEAITNYNNQTFNPRVIIGNNVQFNSDIHIGCIDAIEIHDNCLLGSRILITDHDHGTTNISDINLPPIRRSLFSKGPIVIKKNVWIGDGVAILSGVTIGENSIIGANTVVTKNIEPNSIVVGNSSRVLKTVN